MKKKKNESLQEDLEDLGFAVAELKLTLLQSTKFYIIDPICDLFRKTDKQFGMKEEPRLYDNQLQEFKNSSSYLNFNYGETKQPRTEVLIGDQRRVYDATTRKSLPEALKYYSKETFKYIGSSNVYYINGTENRSRDILHYFVYIPECMHLRRISNR